MRNAKTVALTALLTLPAAAGTVDLPRYPALSPDGTVAVFSWRGDLWKCPVSGGGALRLTGVPSNEGRAAFSPDGATIVFESDRDGGRNLFAMRSDGGDVRQLTFGDAVTLAGCGVDAAGRPVAFFESSRDNDLYRAPRPFQVALAGGPVERVCDAFGSHPVATRDGKSVLMERGGSAWLRRGYQGPDQRERRLGVPRRRRHRLPDRPRQRQERQPLAQEVRRAACRRRRAAHELRGRRP